MQVPIDRVALAEAAQCEARVTRRARAPPDGGRSRPAYGPSPKSVPGFDAIHAERRQVEARTVVADVPQEIDWSWEPAR